MACRATAILIGLLRRSSCGATALAARCFRIGMFVGATWNVATVSRLRGFIAFGVSLAHGYWLLEIGASPAGRRYATVMHSQLARAATSS